MSVDAVRAAVRNHLHGIDASHDYEHVARVERLGLRLAASEGADATLVQLACLLHDVEDSKYNGGDDAAAHLVIRAILLSAGYSEAVNERVCAIIAGVSFHGELGSAPRQLDRETACVQDADRLDALGAIGIARAFTYGGAKGRVLHDPSVPPVVGISKAEYTAQDRRQTTLNHFHEKLFLLRDLMKTMSGRAMAEGRHRVMLDYVKRFEAEWDGH